MYFTFPSSESFLCITTVDSVKFVWFEGFKEKKDWTIHLYIHFFQDSECFFYIKETEFKNNLKIDDSFTSSEKYTVKSFSLCSQLIPLKVINVNRSFYVIPMTVL